MLFSQMNNELILWGKQLLQTNFCMIFVSSYLSTFQMVYKFNWKYVATTELHK